MEYPNLVHVFHNVMESQHCYIGPFLKSTSAYGSFPVHEKCLVVLKLDAQSKQYACAFCLQTFNDVSLAVGGAGCTLWVCSICL